MKKILLLGDSISLYYCPFLAGELFGEAELYQKEGLREAMSNLDKPVGGNGGDSSMLLDYLKERHSAGTLDFDLFAFNCGLHDIKRQMPEEDIAVELSQYEKNLDEIYKLTQDRGLKTVFINSTHVEDLRHNAKTMLGFRRYNSDLDAYNACAADVAARHMVSVIDLNSFTKALPEPKFIDHVHFSEQIRQQQARFIASKLRALFSGGKKCL